MTEAHGSLPDEVVGGLVSLVPIVGPLAAPLAERLSRSVRAEHDRRTSVAMRAAEELSGRSREDLAEEIARDPVLVPLLIRTLYAAGSTGYDETLRALGTALGDAVRDRNLADECDLILASLAGLEEPHVRVLRSVQRGGGDEREPGGGLVTVHHLGTTEAGLSMNMAGLCAAALLSRGLIESLSLMGGGRAYAVTEAGKLLLDVLDQVQEGDA